MNEHALGVLEYDKVVTMLVDRTSFGLGSEKAARLSPTVDLQSIQEDLLRTSELRKLLDDGERLPFEGAHDVRDALARSEAEGASLSCEELMDVRHTLLAVDRTGAFLRARREALVSLCALAESLESATDVSDAIARVVDEQSLAVRDTASRELARIRRSVEKTRSRLDEKLQSILAKELSKDTIQEAAVHIRNGRYVLPVKRSSGGRLKGIVHDQSGSGQTLFVEPLPTVELNNELAELRAAEMKEVERVLREVSGLVGAKAPSILRSLVVMGELDYYRASAVLSRDLDASAPSFNLDGRLRIREGRHPVLLETARRSGGEVVPLNLDLGTNATTVVISGPNAGGKTVTLKTVGLLTLMAQSGLHVPAGADTELSVFRDVYADIGDEQSIEQSLSTFSSHLRVTGEILGEARHDTLVLIDEMGAGTDPDEGASLAIAILEELTMRGAPTIATTHLGSVKNHVHNTDGMENASMAFDPQTLEPSFRFVPGIPGASHALSIAETLGLPDGVLRRARDLRDQDAAGIDELLAHLTERERKLDALVEEAERERNRAALATEECERRLEGVRDERKKLKAQALAEARETLDRAQSLVEETVKEIKAREAARDTIKKAREKLRERRAEVQRQIEVEVREVRPETGRPVRDFVPGMVVRVASLGREGKLVDPPDGKGRVRVRIRNATVEVGSDDLFEVESPVPRTGPRVEVSLDVDVSESPATELHLRGATTDEVRDAIELFVSRALMQGILSIRIVHGKGTGALRTETHAVLRTMPSVKSFRLGRWGEGDTGVTIVELK
jgi:DNA mismatch repair protein MutS2